MRKNNNLNETINVYRTKLYIVIQSLCLKLDDIENNLLVSFDKYYLRTKSRDKRYETYFRNRKNINGKRIKTAMYSRTYL